MITHVFFLHCTFAREIFRFSIDCWSVGIIKQTFCTERNDLFLQVLIRSPQFPVNTINRLVDYVEIYPTEGKNKGLKKT